MKNKQKQAHVARKMNGGDNRIKFQVMRKRKMKSAAFGNLWKCKDGACKKINK